MGADGPAVVVERCTTPRGELQLQRRGCHYEVISNGTFLMATYNGPSERLLVTAALAAARQPRRVLVGGLGVGYSLAAALAHPGVAEVVVFEVEERVVAWGRTYLAPFSDYGLDDPRTRLVQQDLVDWLLAPGPGPDPAPGAFDAVCLDIDNGPDWTVVPANRRLYSPAGLAALRGRLAPGGAAAWWSASASPAFAALLGRHFHRVAAHPVPRERGEPDVVYVAAV